MFKQLSIAAAIVAITIAAPQNNATALEAYSPAQEQQFMDWCTGEHAAKESTCSCTLKSLAQTLPATALVQFLNSKTSGSSGFNMNTTLITTAAMVTQSLTTCASR